MLVSETTKAPAISTYFVEDVRRLPAEIMAAASERKGDKTLILRSHVWHRYLLLAQSFESNPRFRRMIPLGILWRESWIWNYICFGQGQSRVKPPAIVRSEPGVDRILFL